MNTKTPVLFIDDEEHIRLANRQTLEIAGYEVTDLDSADNAVSYLSPQWPGVVVSDIRMQGISGLDFLQQAQTVDADIPIVLISGHGDIAIAVKAIQDGAYDFIEKPFAAEHLIETVNRARDKRLLTLENRQLRGELEAQNAPGPRIIGRTPVMNQLRSTIAQLADTHADILILGETGTGKELIARSLHEHSQRKQKKFVALNCGAVPDNLIESELFGHEEGAFTGASNKRIGKIEDSDGGTLFLDEIESMPAHAQIHLLRVLQERTIERLGSNEIIPLDLRVVAASKVDLQQMEEFRRDLYYRLNVVTIQIPPLRERREDIPLLFEHFLLIASSRYHRDIPPLKGNQIRALLTHSWPGNVRELKNAADRYMLLGESFNYDLEKMIHGSESEITLTLAQQVDCFEKSLLTQELTEQKGSIKNTMEALGLPRKTLYDKMQKYGLDKNHFK